jgi:hypothetical protein
VNAFYACRFGFRLKRLRQAEIEARRVDSDDDCWLFGHYIKRCFAQPFEQCRNMRHYFQETHDGQVAAGKKALQVLALHRLAADSGKANTRLRGA